jgi:hypothetical protein
MRKSIYGMMLALSVLTMLFDNNPVSFAQSLAETTTSVQDNQSSADIQQGNNDLQILKSYTPVYPHKAYMDRGKVRIVFSRIPYDVGYDLVTGYEAVFADGKINFLEHNYIDIYENDLIDGECNVAFRAIFYNGERGKLSNFVKITQDDFVAMYIEEINKRDQLAEMSTILANGVSSTVYAPIMGRIKYFYDASNVTSQEWSFWQHKTDYHRKGGGFKGGADDTYAWDINLNLWNVSTEASDLDRDMAFYPVQSGTVVKWYADDSDPSNDISSSINSKNVNNAVLIKHTDSNGTNWWSGYLHARTLNVKDGDQVTIASTIGNIGKKGNTDKNHLHLAIYTGENKKDSSGNSLLISTNVSFTTTTLTLSPSPSSVTIKKGKKQKIMVKATATRGNASFNAYVNDNIYIYNRLWISSNSSVASVVSTGDGTITANGVGTASITVYFSGEKSTIPVTVTN